MNEIELDALIKKIIKDEVSKEKNSLKEIDPSGVSVVKVGEMIPEKFDTGTQGDQVFVSDLYTLEESPRIGAGLMEMKETTFDWTLKYDEVDYIIEGTLEIIIDGRKIIGNKGDVILIPKNTAIKFSVPNYAKFLYVVYPANWQQL
ncbi:MAG: cupin domain-containing protein [Fusobacteriaceae bacterium]